MINKQVVQNNFSRKAAIYNDCALIQKNAAKKLCKMAQDIICDKSNILDLGAGTSFIAKNLLQFKNNIKITEVDIAENMLKQWKNRPSNVSAIIADIENLPFQEPQIFDIVFSSFALQWIENLDDLFLKLNFLLKENGFLVFCFPCEKTFDEIKTANKKSGCNFLLRNLINPSSIKLKLLQNGFKERKIKHEIITQNFFNATSALKEFKKIGTNYSDNSATKFISKTNLQKFNVFFSQNSNNNASWHLCYLIYQK